MQYSPSPRPTSEPPVHVWIQTALLAVMLLLHVLLVVSVLLNFGVFLSSKGGSFGPSTFESGRLVGNIIALVLSGAFALAGLPWVPLNIYGLVTGKKWARASLIGYWIVCGLSICCAPFAIYPLITLWRPAMKAWFSR